MKLAKVLRRPRRVGLFKRDSAHSTLTSQSIIDRVRDGMEREGESGREREGGGLLSANQACNFLRCQPPNRLLRARAGSRSGRWKIELSQRAAQTDGRSSRPTDVNQATNKLPAETTIVIEVIVRFSCDPLGRQEKCTTKAGKSTFDRYDDTNLRLQRSRSHVGERGSGGGNLPSITLRLDHIIRGQ